MFASVIQPVVATYGLWAVFFIVMLESAGLPLPGETALVSAAVFAGATGDLTLASVVAVATVAAIFGDNIGFWVGRRYGQPLIRRFGPLVGLDERQLSLGNFLFERHGAKIVFFGRFVAFLRMFAALLAGMNGFGWRRFLVFNAAGAVVWASIFGVSGFLLGDRVTRISGPLGMAAFVLALSGIAAFVWLAQRGQKRYFEKIERDVGPSAQKSGKDA